MSEDTNKSVEDEKRAHRNKLAAMFEKGPLMGMPPPGGVLKKKKSPPPLPTKSGGGDKDNQDDADEQILVNGDTAVTKNLEDDEIAGISMLYKEGERGRSKSRAQLEAQNVLPTNSKNVAPALSGVKMELERQLKKDRLEALYSDRPEQHEVAPEMFEERKSVVKKAPPPLPTGSAAVKSPPPVPAASMAKMRQSVLQTREESDHDENEAEGNEDDEEPKQSNAPVVAQKKTVKSEPQVEKLSSLDFPELSRHRAVSMQQTQEGLPGLIELVKMLQVRLVSLRHEQSALMADNIQLRQEINTLSGYTSRFSMQDLEALVGGEGVKKPTVQSRKSVLQAPAELFLLSGGDDGIKTVFFQGWLMKEGSWGSWKRRYFCIYEDRVEYFASPNDTMKPAESLHFGKLLCAISPMRKRKGVKKECMELAFDDGRKQKVWRFYVDGDTHGRVSNQWFRQFRNRIEHMEYLRTCLLNHQNPDVRLLKFFNSSMRGGPIPLLLRDQPLSFYSVRALSNVLGDEHFPCRQVAELDLANAGLCTEEVVLLGNSLAECVKSAKLKHFPSSNLCKLNLSGNEMGDGEGVKELASALQHSHSLRHLILHKCQLGDDGVKVIASVLEHTDLEHLALSRNHIGNAGAVALASAIKKGRSESSMSQRPTVSLKDRVLLTEENMIMPSVIADRQSVFGIAGDSMDDLERETRHTLVHLDLSHNNIGGAGGIGIADMLGGITRLQTVFLHSNKLNDESAVAIGAAVQKNGYIRVLDLSMNAFQHDGGVALSHMAQLNHSLTEVHFMGHHLRIDALTALRLTAQNNDAQSK